MILNTEFFSNEQIEYVVLWWCLEIRERNFRSPENVEASIREIITAEANEFSARLKVDQDNKLDVEKDRSLACGIKLDSYFEPLRDYFISNNLNMFTTDLFTNIGFNNPRVIVPTMYDMTLLNDEVDVRNDLHFLNIIWRMNGILMPDGTACNEVEVNKVKNIHQSLSKLISNNRELFERFFIKCQNKNYKIQFTSDELSYLNELNLFDGTYVANDYIKRVTLACMYKAQIDDCKEGLPDPTVGTLSILELQRILKAGVSRVNTKKYDLIVGEQFENPNFVRITQGAYSSFFQQAGASHKPLEDVQQQASSRKLL